MFETWRAFINGKKLAEAEVMELKRLLTNAVEEVEKKKDRIEVLELELRRAKEKYKFREAQIAKLDVYMAS